MASNFFTLMDYCPGWTLLNWPLASTSGHTSFSPALGGCSPTSQTYLLPQYSVCCPPVTSALSPEALHASQTTASTSLPASPHPTKAGKELTESRLATEALSYMTHVSIDLPAIRTDFRPKSFELGGLLGILQIRI